MPSYSLTSNTVTPASVRTSQGQLIGVKARGTLGEGKLNAILQSVGGLSCIVQSYAAADQNTDGVISFSIDVPVDNALTLSITGATSPSMTVDIDQIRTY